MQRFLMTARTVLVADTGKSTTRVALCRDGIVGNSLSGPGIDGLTLSGGVEDTVARIDALVPPPSTEPVAAVSVGVAGALGAPEAAAELARLLAERWSAPASVASDVVTAHLGARAGGAGTILIAGTGAVALSVREDGTVRLADGLGPELGDFGSGYWIGRAGLRAALRADATTALREHARDHVERGEPPRWLAAQQHPLAAVARFAPVVLDCAADGDRVALAICDEAVHDLTQTILDVSAPGEAVSVLGGLSSHPWFRRRLVDAIAGSDRHPLPPAGSALQGALLAADRADLPHERLIHRAV